MQDYEERMLTLLVEKYRKSKKDRGTGRINRRTQIKPTELYKGYLRNDGDLNQINGINTAAERCKEMGFVFFEREKFSNEIPAIYLVDEKVEKVEQYLAEHYQYVSKHEKMKRAEAMIAKYRGHCPVADQECARLQSILDKNMVPKGLEQAEDILKALVFIEQNRQPLYVREASMLIYGSSKYLEENTLEAVCGLFRKYRNETCQDNELFDEILGKYQIVKEKQRICLKGDISIVKDGKQLELGAFRSGIELYTDDLSGVQHIFVRSNRFMTVENKTTYMRCGKEGTSYFYLGGYANRFQRDILKMIYADNPGIHYLHFGDIDAGGFYIHENLCRITGIPFALYRMDAAELQDPLHEKCLLRLSDNDRRRLRSLMNHDAYRQTVEYMLEHDVKLEQEIVGLY